MKRKNFDFSANIMFALVCVVLINIISYFGFFRFDLTKNRIYSLSSVSKKIISKFDDYILIRAVFSKTLPEQFRFIRLYVEDLLKEYKIYSKGKIKFEFIDPQQPNSKISEDEVYSMGIVPVEFSVLEKDKFEVKKGYMGLAMLYKGNREVIPVVNNIENLEYDITSTLKKLTLKEKKAIGIVETAGCDTLENNEVYDRLKQQLQKFYELRNIKISSETLKDIAGLLVISPKENFKDEELFYLDQFILSGKPVVFLANRYDINLQTFFARKIASNIFDLISHYGAEIEDGLVVDYQCQKISLTMQQGFIIMQNIVDYPFIPAITKIDKNHPLVKDLNQVSLAFVSPIKIKQNLQNISYTVLFETSKRSFVKKDVYSVNPLRTDFSFPKDAHKGPFIAGVELKGKFKSYFDENKFKDLKLSTTFYYKETEPQAKESRIIVIPTGEISTGRENVLLANIIDYLAQDYELLTIRSKKIALSPIKEVSPTLKLIYRYFITLFPPIFVVFVGLYRWYLRKTKPILI
jgi:gliding-associated putative ABC transporter substrate-binding component GldG